jgi:hypothetical protein
MRILDARFKYTPALDTNIVATWKRFGYRPTTDAERAARQRRTQQEALAGIQPTASVTALDSVKRKAPALRMTGRHKAAAAAGDRE